MLHDHRSFRLSSPLAVLATAAQIWLVVLAGCDKQTDEAPAPVPTPSVAESAVANAAPSAVAAPQGTPLVAAPEVPGHKLAGKPVAAARTDAGAGVVAVGAVPSALGALAHAASAMGAPLAAPVASAAAPVVVGAGPIAAAVAPAAASAGAAAPVASAKPPKKPGLFAAGFTGAPAASKGDDVSASSTTSTTDNAHRRSINAPTRPGAKP